MNFPQECETLMSQHSEAALGTIEVNGPFVSAVGYLYEAGSTPKAYILLSDLARHTKNLKQNSQVSLLIQEKNEAAAFHERKRVTLQGEAALVESKELFQSLKAKYLKRFPKAELFFSLPDFRFYEIRVKEIHWISGFGKAGTAKI